MLRSQAYLRLLCILAVLAAAVGAFPRCVCPQTADDDSVKTITAVRVNPSVRIDGILDEAFWAHAPRSGGFIQYQPDEGSPGTESTFVRVAYDDEALYVGMEMYDSEPEKIINRLTRRDRWVDADLVHLIIDSHHDHQTAYAFTLYASGTQRDVYYYNDTWSDEDWDAVWDAATKVTDQGWTAEYKIPFHCLRFTCEENPVWGIYFSRSIGRKSELDRWLYIPESAPGFVSHFGHLKGLKGLSPPKRLEVRPYGVSYAESESKTAGNPDGRDYSSNIGFDVKYGLTSNITLDAALNPDFGQVEADETVLNLSAFETWYPEKRPFFVEGSKIFETYYGLFYSRRIGRPPAIWPDDADYYTERPAATTILGAVKVSGKTSSGTSIGIMESVTQREKAKYVDTLDCSRHEIIEPEANYLAARVNQDILENSTVGLMATAVNQKTYQPQYTGGVDWNLRFHEGGYQVSGQVVGSKTGPQEDGMGASIHFEKHGGEHFRGALNLDYRDRGLDLNRMGFLNRADYREAFVWFQYRTTEPWWIIRKTWHNINVGYSENLSGVKLTQGGNYNNSIELTNFWSVGVGSWRDYHRGYCDLETRDGPPAPIPIGQNWWTWLNTDSRRSWQLNAHVEGGDTWDGTYNSYSLWIELKPRSNVEMSLGPSYRRSRGVSRWLTSLEDDDGNRTDEIFGEQDMDRFGLMARGTLTFTRDLTLQVYAQPFIAAVDYSNFKRLVPPDGYEYVDSSVYSEEEEQPDFNWTSYNSNVILRWEYRPGSTLYLVWTQARDSERDLGDFNFDRDWSHLFGTPATNTFLAKLSYWWTL